MTNHLPNAATTTVFDSQDPFGEIVGVIQPWFNQEHADVYGFPAVRNPGGVLMGIPVWGKPFLDRFFLFCLPTLGAPENLAALKGRCRLVIYSEEAWRPYVHRRTAWLRRAGIEVLFRPIPQAVMDIVGNHYGARFRLLACVQNVLMHMAGVAGMGLHMLQPDHLYSRRYFANMFRLASKHQALVHISLNALLSEKSLNEIEAFRSEDGMLAIPDRELGDWGYRHMHAQCRLHSMNDAKIPSAIPQSHRLWWQGKDFVQMYSSHENPAWLAPELCVDAPVAFTSTMDTLLPELVPPEVDFHVPTVEDEMTFVEFSDGEKPANRPYVPLEEFCGEFWRNGSFSREYVPYFSRPTRIPIRPKASYIIDEEIERQFTLMMKHVMAVEDAVALEWLRKRHSSRFAKAAELPEVLR